MANRNLVSSNVTWCQDMHISSWHNVSPLWKISYELWRVIHMVYLHQYICKLWDRINTSSHCIAVVSLWAIKIEVRLFARDFRAFRISASVVLSSALVASSQNLEKEWNQRELKTNRSSKNINCRQWNHYINKRINLVHNSVMVHSPPNLVENTCSTTNRPPKN